MVKLTVLDPLKFLAAAMLLVSALGTGSAGDSLSLMPADAHGVIERMSSRNPTLHSYRARVHVDVRMLNFPWLAPKLDGTSYFKRPD
jgi:hypothetical protein